VLKQYVAVLGMLLLLPFELFANFFLLVSEFSTHTTRKKPSGEVFFSSATSLLLLETLSFETTTDTQL